MKANSVKIYPVRAMVAILLCLGMALATMAGPAVAEPGLQPGSQANGAPYADRSARTEAVSQPASGSPGQGETAPSAGLLSHRIVATIPLTPGVGLQPTDIAADPNSPLVYIANQGGRDIAVFSGTTALGMLAGLGAEMDEGEIFRNAYEIRLGVHPTTGLLYAIEGMRSRRSFFEQVFTLQVVRTDLLSSSEIQATPVITPVTLLSCWLAHGGYCEVSDFAFQPTNGYLYLTEYVVLPFPAPNRFGYITVMEGGTKVTTITLPEVLPRFIAADSQRGLVYATAYYTDSVFVVSGTTLLDTVPVSAAGQIKFQPASGLVYIQSGEGQLAVLSGTNRLAQTSVGEMASMAAHPRNPFLYISHPATPTVTVVSGTAVLTEVEVISPGGALEVNPTTGLVYLRHPGAPFVSILSGTEVLTQVVLFGGDAAIEANPVTGLVYAVDGLDSVAVLEDTRQTGHLQAAFPRPMAMEWNPVNGQVVLVGSGHSSTLSLIQGEEIMVTVPLTFAPGKMAIHPYNGLIYLTDPDGHAVQVFSGTALLFSVPIEGEPRDIVVQPYNGLVYVPDSIGVLNVLSGTERISIPLGSYHQAQAAVDPERGWVYVTEGQYPEGDMYIITGTQVVTNVYFDILSPGIVAVEPRSGYVYVGTRDCTEVISGTSLIARIYHDGRDPKDIEVAPATGYVYLHLHSIGSYGEIRVIQGGAEISSWRLSSRFSSLRAHPQSNYFYAGQGVYGSLLSIGIGPTLVTTMTVGDGSWVRSIAVDPETGRVYVATDHTVAILEEYLPYRFHLPVLLKNGSEAEGRSQTGVLSYPPTLSVGVETLMEGR